MSRRRRFSPHGIPTYFKGVRYRSRLEARWASFFEFLGWRADYEPVDLDGWIPDFAVDVPGDGVMLVECKPALRVDDLYQYVEKVDRARPPGQGVLLVGARWGEELGLRVPECVPFGLESGPGGIHLSWQTVDDATGAWLKSGLQGTPYRAALATIPSPALDQLVGGPMCCSPT